ncbi:metal cation symporter ZIP8-like [Periplaneta americana]|uniref:metal cation symporter ZIP8-like n=1 Tax=Periplaneta americana TaxID=6978 RepID=UPI0037E79232
MCFGKVFVTLLTLPWLNNAMNRHTEMKLLILYKTPPGIAHHELQHVLSQVQQEIKKAHITSCKPGETDICITTNQCNKVETVVFENSTCSWLVYNEELQQNISQHDPSSLKVWIFGVVSVGIISLSGLFGGLFWPLINSNSYNQMMRILIGLAVGSLTATSTFQLIPEGFNMKDNEDYLDTAVVMWSSLWLLYMFEVLSKIAFHKRSENETKQVDTNDMQTNMLSTFQNCENCGRIESEMPERKELLPKSSHINSKTSQLLEHSIQHGTCNSLNRIDSKTVKHDNQKKPGAKTTVAYMIIFGDAIHNFIDGMSIGAGYSKDLSAGIGISMAVACEEFPHELGDFAILINSGLPLKKALLYNFLSACTSFGGLVLGILMGELQTSVYVFAFAGGLFLYVSLADLMPELNRMVDEELEKNKISALKVLLLQNCGIFIGVTTLYLITRYPVIIS